MHLVCPRLRPRLHLRLHLHLHLRLLAVLATVAGMLPLSLSAQSPPTARFDLSGTQTVLPKTVLPSRVQLTLDLDPAKPDFSGAATLDLQATQPVPAIVLHAKGLVAQGASLMSASGDGAPRALKVEPDAATETWRLVPEDGTAIAAGAWRLAIRYQGRVNNTDDGLFKVDYRAQGQPARMLATQLEATHARNVLPVFDEPVFRAVFELTVRAPAGLQVLSNTPETATQALDGGVVEHRFAATPAMPSYLLAVSVGRFDVLEDSVDGIPLRIFTAAGKRAQARFAMDVTKQILPFYARYFGRPYALPKLDQIAVPGTRTGAMEDWGLISYIESALLFDAAGSDAQTERVVFSVVAHEVAHQWFGNLVSASSWNEIWLNEAFATWMANKTMEALHPEWQSALRRRRDMGNVMRRDATAATRAIRSGPVSEASVFEVFDGVTYSKGGAVLTMLEQWLGPDVFQRGMAGYMVERAFKPATAGDLWFHMARAAGKPLDAVARVAASWTDQPGLPLVSVSARCVAGNTQVGLSQRRFAAGPPLPAAQWQVPVRLLRAAAPGHAATERTVLLTGARMQTTLPGCTDAPVLANAGGRGYFVVAYEAEPSRRVAAAFAQLAPADRITVLADSFVLASEGQRTMAQHFDLLAALPLVHDTSRGPLYTLAASQLQTLETALGGTPAQAPLRAAALALLAPELARLGWQDGPGAGGAGRKADNESDTLRATLIQRLGTLDHAPTVAAARQRLAAALAPAGGASAAAGATGAPGATGATGATVAAAADSVPRGLRAPIIGVAGRHADDADFARLLAALQATESEEQRHLLAEALASGRDPVRAQRLLDESLKGSLPAKVSVRLPGMVAEFAPALSPVAYAFAVAHWPALSALAGDGPFGGRHWLLPNTAAGLSDAAAARQLVLDQQRLDGPAGASTARQVAAAIDARARLRAREADSLGDALRGWAPKRE